MRLTFPILLLFCITTLLVGHTLYEADLKNDEVRDIYNLTETYLNWNDLTNFTGLKQLDTNNFTNKIAEVRTYRINKILTSFINFIGVTSFESSKYLLEFGYNHPEYDYEFYFKFIKWYLIFIVAVMLIPLIIPSFVLISLITIGLHKLIKKIIERRRERLKKLSRRKSK